MYKELQENPNCEICVATTNFEWLRINAQVEEVDDIELKQKVLDINDLVKSLYQSANNPTFVLFTVSGDATIADFSGEAPKTYKI